ncbi:MAG: homoserine kinase [Polynucleobacter sp.]|nr:homoserine kinase [Polynucleobacter sp.]MDZ4056498.1 homoserine kinase [Polynucleobacter sp.]
MAVFTPIELSDIAHWISTDFAIGKAKAIRGIQGGIENSNFFLDTEMGGSPQEYVLTIFERLSAAQLPYYLELMRHLANQGIPVPKPIANHAGTILFDLKSKPAAIVSKLPGVSRMEPNSQQCAMVGSMLAKMHLAGSSFAGDQPNLRSLPWWRETAPKILPHLSAEQSALLNDELHFQEVFFASTQYQNLPAGASHCDLFRDNVLFEGEGSQERLGGFFDFYFAGTDKWLFDLAVTINDWCLAKDGGLDADRTQALVTAYQSVRPLTADELQGGSAMLRAAALRFWISRLWDFYLPRDAQMLTPHDPKHFERILLHRRKPATTSVFFGSHP